MNTPTRSYPELRFRLTVIIRYVAGRDGRSIRDVYRQAMSAFEGDAVQPFEHVEAFEVLQEQAVYSAELRIICVGFRPAIGDCCKHGL